MAQLSRPYQIGLAAVAVLGAAWFLLIGGHSGSGSGSTAGGSSQVASTPPHAATAAAPKAVGTAGSPTGHGSASSLGGLGHAIEKARGAVTTSRQNEKNLNERSAQASSETTTTSTPRPAETTAAPTSTKSTGVTSTPSARTSAPSHPKAVSPGAAHPGAAARQQSVERQLSQGKIAVILFWEPRGAEDQVVHKALGSLRGDSSLKIAVDEALPSEVAAFGTITRGVQVYGTPTMLFVDRQGRTVTLTGLQDAYSISQAVRQARRL